MEAVSDTEKQEETVVESVGGDSAKQISRIQRDFISTGAALTHRKTHILSSRIVLDMVMTVKTHGARFRISAKAWELIRPVARHVITPRTLASCVFEDCNGAEPTKRINVTCPRTNTIAKKVRVEVV